MLVVGLTGGIGSGKSTVATLFAQKAVHVIEADDIAHRLIEPDQVSFAAIVQHFGKNILNSDSKINRHRLAQIIFNDVAAKTWLENLLHPLIYAAMNQELITSSACYGMLVIPLLLEKPVRVTINRVLVVDAPVAMQRSRVYLRDERTYEEIDAIIASQMDREQRLRRADDIIINDTSVEHLETQVKRLHEFYLRLALRYPIQDISRNDD